MGDGYDDGRGERTCWGSAGVWSIVGVWKEGSESEQGRKAGVHKVWCMVYGVCISGLGMPWAGTLDP